jgi:trk system potassium uptake protein TrkA
VPTHPLTHLLDIREKGLEIVEVKIPPKSPTIGKKVKELSLPKGSILMLIIHQQGKPEVPTTDTTLQAEDQIIAVTNPEAEEALRTKLRGL